MEQIVLWGRGSAFNVQKVLWALGELGVPFEHREVGGRFGGLDDPAFLALNPHGRVPVLVDRGVAIWESHTILRYLAASYATERVWPRSPAACSFVDRWMDWSQSTLQPEFLRLFWAFYRTPADRRDAKKIEDAAAACDRCFRFLDARLAAQPFLAGDEFTLADIPAGTTLHRYFDMGLPVPRHPHVRAWHERLAARPAYQRHVAVPFDELFGRLEF